MRDYALDSEIADFYWGLNPTQLTSVEKLGFAGNIPRLKARRTREEISMTPGASIKAESLYDLVLAETGDEELAQKTVHKHLFQLAIEGKPIE